MANSIQFEEGALQPTPVCGRVCNFLGAGFSAATKYELPTSVGFLSETVPFYSQNEKNEPEVKPFGYATTRRDFPGLLERIKEQYGPLEELNLEDVLTSLHVRSTGVGRSWERTIPMVGSPLSIKELRHDYDTLIAYIQRRLQLQGDSIPECPLVNKSITTLKRQDSIVTLNYDYILELYLHAKTEESEANPRLDLLQKTIGPPSLGGDSGPTMMFDANEYPNTGFLVKLHGSIDWVTCPNANCPNNSFVHSFAGWFKNQPKNGLNPRCIHCATAPEMVIVPPIATKEFEKIPKLGLMWQQAYEALRTASRWTFIGVSFAPTDFHLRALIHAATRDANQMNAKDDSKGQICVVGKDFCGAKKSACKLIDAFYPSLKKEYLDGSRSVAIFDSVENYLNSVEITDVNREDQRLKKKNLSQNIQSP